MRRRLRSSVALPMRLPATAAGERRSRPLGPPRIAVVTFAIGDRVVYPQHGATVIDRVEVIDVLGSAREYLVLHFSDGGVTLRVPAEAAGAVGMREVISGDEADEVFSVLRRRDVHVPSNWSRRFKNHATMLKSGDVYQVAEVVRNLSRRNATKSQSNGEH